MKSTDTTVGTTIPDPDADPAQPRLATFDRPAERYQLGDELGRGGMGRVVQATDVTLARTVAIKQVLSERADDLVRFEREVKITAELEHPSIVPIYEAARDAEGRPYYVMRRLDGEPLSARLAGATRVARLGLLPNLLAVVDAAAFAHARGIIHRDIKPSNILLGAYGETHLIDWGLARRLDDLDVSGVHAATGEDLTRVGHVYGTVGYMAPEQARGERVDSRADVYALGATLFHVLAGHAPFAHLSDVERLSAAALGEDHPPLDKLDDEIPQELIAIVDKAMAPACEARYQHAGELAMDLRAFLGGQLVGAHRYTTRERVRRFVGKHRFAVALTLVSLIVVAMVLGISVSRIVEGRDAAEAAREDAERARVEAVARAELLLIERASTLAPIDPTRAAALLKDVPVATRHAGRARDAISKVASFGITSGAAPHHGPVNGLAFSRDGTQLASVGEDGRVVRYDVARGHLTTIIELHAPLYGVDWLDDHTLLVTGHRLAGGRRIDLTTLAVEPFTNADDMFQWWLARDGVRWLDSTSHTLFEKPRMDRTAPARALAQDVAMATGQGDVAMFTSRDGKLFVLEGEAVRELVRPVAQELAFLTVRPDGKRVAAAWRGGVAEWEVATAKQVERWDTVPVVGLAYAPRHLIATGTTESLYQLSPNGGMRQTPIRLTPLWQTQIASGLVLGFEDGTLSVFDRAGMRSLQLGQAAMRRLASLPDRMMLAAGSRDGTVRWVDLDPVTPPPLPLPQNVTPCTASERAMYGMGREGLFEVDLATGQVRTLPAEVETSFGTSCVALGQHLIVFSPIGLTILDLPTGATRVLANATSPSADRDRAIYGVDATVYELAAGGEPRAIYTAAEKVLGVAMNGDWIALSLGRGRILRHHRKTGETETLSFGRPGFRFGLLPGGQVWHAIDNELFLWDRENRLIKRYAKPIRLVFQFGRQFYIGLEDGSVQMTEETGATVQRIPPGKRELLAIDGIVVGTASRQVTTYYMGSGESVTRDLSTSAIALPVLDGRGVLTRSDEAVVLYVDPVPVDFPAAKTWLEHATNAGIEPETGALRWETGVTASPGTPRGP